MSSLWLSQYLSDLTEYVQYCYPLGSVQQQTIICLPRSLKELSILRFLYYAAA